MRRSATLALASAMSLAASAATAQTLTITEVDHVGNRITVTGPGVDQRIVDLDDAVISGANVRNMSVSDLNTGDQVVVDGTLSGTRLNARSVQIVPPPGGRGALPTADPDPTTPERVPTGPRGPSAMERGAPLPPPSPGTGAMQRP
jgi:hypothetical protein